MIEIGDEIIGLGVVVSLNKGKFATNHGYAGHISALGLWDGRIYTPGKYWRL